jgi:opacity protein-like surface antigen
MSNRKSGVRRCSLALFTAAVLSAVSPGVASGQGFISPSFGYNFGGDSGCAKATDCEDKNWNLGVSLGTHGAILGFEAELTYENNFLGKTSVESTDVLTLMGNLMLAPKIAIVRPYGLAGLGLIRTSVEVPTGGSTAAENLFGWTVGAGLVVYLNDHVGVKGDIRHYHAFQTLELFGIDVARDENKLDFGRAAFGLLLSF